MAVVGWLTSLVCFVALFGSVINVSLNQISAREWTNMLMIAPPVLALLAVIGGIVGIVRRRFLSIAVLGTALGSCLILAYGHFLYFMLTWPTSD